MGGSLKMQESRILLAAVLVSAGMTAVAGACLAHGYRFGTLQLLHPSIAAPNPGEDRTCAFVTLVNHGAMEERLLAFRIGIARSTDIMTVTAAHKYHHAPHGILIPPGERINLHTDGWCLLLDGLAVSLEADVGFYSGTLDFQHAGTITVDFMVDPPTE